MAREKAVVERKVMRLRQLRRGREMTQADLARRVGLTAPHINAIERGRAKPSFGKGLEIAAVFGLPAEEVFSFVELPAYDSDRPSPADVLGILKATE